MTIEQRVHNYLKDQGLSHEDIQLETFIKEFHQDMDAGLAGEKSSMAMLPTYIRGVTELPRNEKVIVLDAGGTNFRAALVHFDEEGRAQVEHFRKTSMPGFDREVGILEFYERLVDHFADFADQAQKIGFCFSYPAEITPDHDAIPIFFTKEIKASQVLGKSIKENLQKTLAAKGLKSDHELVVVNDTVSTLLTAMLNRPGREYSAYIGFILGTGINGCYLERQDRIKKSKPCSLNEQIINTECGSYENFPRGKADEAFDRTTKVPGRYYLEKVSSGAYFGPLCTIALRQAAQDGLFSDELCRNLQELPDLQTKDADGYLNHPQNPKNPLVKALQSGTIEDKEGVFWFIDGLLERAAKIMSGTLAALVLRNPGGESPLHPVCMNVDGTTFYAYYRFQCRVQKYLDKWLTRQKGRYYEIIRVDDAPLLGAAMAALTQ